MFQMVKSIPKLLFYVKLKILGLQHHLVCNNHQSTITIVNTQNLLTCKITFSRKSKNNFFIFMFKLVETNFLFTTHLLSVRIFFGI